MCIEQTAEFLLLFGKHTTFIVILQCKVLHIWKKKTPYLLRCILILFSGNSLKDHMNFMSSEVHNKKTHSFLELWKFIIGLYDFHEF
jgi:hypothetical protein